MNIESYNLSRADWEQLIEQWIFNERNRMILKRRLLDGICYEPLAVEFDMSVRAVQKIVADGLKQLNKRIKQGN